MTPQQISQKELVDHYKSSIEEAISRDESTVGMQELEELRVFINDMLKKQGSIPEAEIFASRSDTNHLIRLIKQYKDLIEYAFNESVDALNPLRTHSLMQKKLSEMTGYEYRRFLQILDTQS